MAAVRWYSQSASDRFRGNRVYRFTIRTTFGGVVQAIAELSRHGRVLYQAQNQPGTSVRTNVMVALLYWLPAASVVDRGDALSVLYRTLTARSSSTVTRAQAAQISEGARENMWAAAGSHPAAQLSISGFQSLSGLTWTEQVSQSARGTATHVQEAASAAATAVGESVDDVVDTVDNTILYTKLALGLVGIGAAVFIVTGGKPSRLLSGISR
jgi:hypothetical protein